MVTKSERWYKPIYKRLQGLGIQVTPIAARLGISRQALRKWFYADILDERRAELVADALEDYARDISDIAREMRKGFREEIPESTLMAEKMLKRRFKNHLKQAS